MKPSGVLAFFVLACAFSWAYWIPVALFGPTVERGDAWPTQVPGLFGPMLAAFVVVGFTECRAGTRELLRSMARRPRGARAQLATVAPLVFLGFALVVAGVLGDAPAASDFLRYSGTAATTLALFAALVVTGFGEETGWRGCDGLIAPLITACVIFWAIGTVQRHRSGRRLRGRPLVASRHV